MKVAGAVFWAIVVGHMATAASGVNVPCSAGTRVYSLTVWSGYWLDGLVMRCTGDSEEEPIPSELNDDAGGSDVEGICAGTEGVKSLEWLVPTAIDSVMTYVNITCLDNATYEFANRWEVRAHNRGVLRSKLGLKVSRVNPCQEKSGGFS